MRIAVLASILLGFSAQVAIAEDCPASAQAYQTISLVALLSDPAKHTGQFVRITGYLHLIYEGDGLFLHKEDYRQWIPANAIGLSIPARDMNKSLNHEYVTVLGQFSGDPKLEHPIYGSRVLRVCRFEE